MKPLWNENEEIPDYWKHERLKIRALELLKESDFVLASDCPLPQADIKEVKDYRQILWAIWADAKNTDKHENKADEVIIPKKPACLI